MKMQYGFSAVRIEPHRWLLRGVAALASLAMFFAGSGGAQEARANSYCYVDQNVVGGTGDGSTWVNAWTDLQSALTSGNCVNNTIQVAQGVYHPTTYSVATDRETSFYVKPGMILEGGYRGYPSADGTRDPEAYLTVLSGDIDGNDSTDNGVTTETNGNIGNNSYHVVLMDNSIGVVTGTTVISGFTITAGRPDGPGGYGAGGGIECFGAASGNICSPTLSNLRFIGNTGGRGAALHTYAGASGTTSPSLTDVTFQNNGVDGWGGAVYNHAYGGGTASPSFTNVTFFGNFASEKGGAIYNDGGNGGNASPSFTNVTFYNNVITNYSAGNGGGAVYNDGSAGTSSPTFINVTFNGNDAGTAAGGAIYNAGASAGVSDPSFTNVILWGDTASSGHEMYNDSATPSVNYSVVQDGDGGSNTGTAWSSGTGNSSGNPYLVGLADNGGATQTIALGWPSSAIDAGTACSATDQRGVPRPRGGACDIGAYERVPAAVGMWGNGYLGRLVVYSGGAWNRYDRISGGYSGGTWTGNPGGNCIPAPMDTDGDGIKNFSQLCGGAWHFYDDVGTYAKGIWVGNVAGQRPVPADYDGDGIDDVVVFQGGAWNKYNYDAGSYAGGVWTGNPGGVGVPAPMDYNGDGIADPTILSAGAWHFYNDNGTYNKGIWVGNVGGQFAVPGDYNGDGTDEPWVFRAGAWLPYDFATGSYLSSDAIWTGAPVSGSGIAGPAPVDYDGDGRLDFTYYGGAAWHLYFANGSYYKGIWTGNAAGNVALSRRALP